MHTIILIFWRKFSFEAHIWRPSTKWLSHAVKTMSNLMKSMIIISIIKEMQAELDSFFRAKKARKVQLTGEDILYLEVMLAQAIGPAINIRENVDTKGQDAILSKYARRFLVDFFTLKTKPQVQLRESTFHLVKTMVDHTLNRALSEALASSAEFEYNKTLQDVPAESTAGPSPSPSPISSVEVTKQPSPTNLFCERPLGRRSGTLSDGHWLRMRISSDEEDNDVPIRTPIGRQRNIIKLPVALLNQPTKDSEDECTPSKLPIKKRKIQRPGDEAIVPRSISLRSRQSKGQLKLRIIRKNN